MIFQDIDVLSDPRLRSSMVAHYVNEEVKAYEPRREGPHVLIDQPASVPARWDYDIRGLALGKTRLAGDLDAEVVLDLGRSRFSPRTGAPERYSCFVLETVFAGEGSPTRWVKYAPSLRDHPRGAVWDRADERRFAWKKTPRRLIFHFRRRTDRLTVSLASEQGPLGQVLDWQAPEAGRPIRQIGLFVQVDRPGNAAKEPAWKAPGKDVYALVAFTVSCADPKGCTVRVR